MYDLEFINLISSFIIMFSLALMGWGRDNILGRNNDDRFIIGFLSACIAGAFGGSVLLILLYFPWFMVQVMLGML